MKNPVKYIIGGVISILLLALLFRMLDMSDIIQTFSNISLVLTFWAFIFYVVSYIFRALRFNLLTHKKLRLLSMFKIVSLHNFFNNLIPFRIGELSYVLLVKKSGKIRSAAGLSSLMVARIFDYAAISSIFLVSLVLQKSVPSEILNILGIMLFIIIVPIILLLLLLFGSNKLIKAISPITKLKIKFIDYVYGKLEETALHLKGTKAETLFLTFIYSLPIWSSQYLMNFILLKQIGMDISLQVAMLGSTLSTLLSLLPVPTLGGFGIIESVWAVSFVVLGFPKELAIASGFNIHIFVIAFMLMINLFALLIKEERAEP